MSDPCGSLTDSQYLHHMIPHHQMALDMSQILIKTSSWPELLTIARNIIWVQQLEIDIMKAVLAHSYVDKVSSDAIQKKDYIITWGDLTYPNQVDISNIPCKPEFFGHNHESHKMEITDNDYITHMIPHHQLAIDMSKRLLKNTKNDYMIDLAYNIIRNQQAEIAKLSALSNSNTRFQSDLLR